MILAGVMGLHDDPHFGSSLGLAAALIGRTPEELKGDPTLNIRGAAALLRHFSGGATRATPLEEWEDDIWNPAPECNFTASRTEPVTHIAEHIMEGVYSGTISWFKNCASAVSAHYLVRSSGGQITQMVRESDTGFHVAGHNRYSIGIEHEGFANNCAWYTATMYVAFAALTRDIADRHGIPRTTTYDASVGWDTELPRDAIWKFKGHTNFPTAKSCPGPCFDWVKYRTLVIAAPVPVRRRAVGR